MTNEERTHPYPRRYGYALVNNKTNWIEAVAFTKAEIHELLKWNQRADELHIERVRIASMVRREQPGDTRSTHDLDGEITRT